MAILSITRYCLTLIDMRRSLFYLLFQLMLLISSGQAIDLSQHWQFRQAGKTHWRTAVVPGSVHTDLLRNKLIPDPFFADNESKLAWIDNVDWEYKTNFSVTSEMLNNSMAELHFHGLDTYADIYLNNSLLFSADNMFRTWKMPIQGSLKPGKNELRIYFHSAKKRVDSMAKLNLPLT
ncbi:MAG: hypothetical protein EOO13_17715, partial [Chitinophagaceae bacterium]